MTQAWRKQCEALHELNQIAVSAGLDQGLMLVGATARLLQLDWPAGLESQRTTKDLDLTLQCENWDQYLQLAKLLTDKGHFETGRQPHQFRHVTTQSIIDLIPYGGIEQPIGNVTWSETGNRMSVTGMAEARANAETMQTADGAELAVVSLPWFVVLKIIAWTDRRNSDKGAGDLKDADYVMRNCLRLKRYELAAWDAYAAITELSAVGHRLESLDYGEHAGVAVIATELGRTIAPETRELLLSALAPLANNPYAPGIEHLLGLPPRANDEQHRECVSLRFAILSALIRTAS